MTRIPPTFVNTPPPDKVESGARACANCEHFLGIPQTKMRVGNCTRRGPVPVVNMYKQEASQASAMGEKGQVVALDSFRKR